MPVQVLQSVSMQMLKQTGRWLGVVSTQCLQIITDLVMAIRILDKDITQRRKGWGNDLRNSDGLAWILEQVFLRRAANGPGEDSKIKSIIFMFFFLIFNFIIIIFSL